MKSTRLALAAVLILGSLTLVSSPALLPQGHADELKLLLNVPTTAHPGDKISIELWTVINFVEPGTNVGGTRSVLAYNATGANCTTIPCLSFAVKANLNASNIVSTNDVVVPHIHTPSGGFVPLPPFRPWVHHGAWITNYTVPSELGLYGVHLFANYSISTNNYFISQAATTFSVQAAPVEAASLATAQNLIYATLGVAILAVLLDIVILMRKRIPAMSK